MAHKVYCKIDHLTCCTVLGINGGWTFAESKKTSSALAILVNRLAMILLVLIATSIEADLSPITTTGDSKFKLQKRDVCIHIKIYYKYILHSITCPSLL